MNQGQIQTWPWFTSTLWNRLRWSQRGSSKLLKRRSQAGPTTSWPTYWAVAFPVGRPHSSQESSLGKGYGGSVRNGKQEKRNKNKHQKKQQDEKINKRARKRRTAVKILKEKETERGEKRQNSQPFPGCCRILIRHAESRERKLPWSTSPSFSSLFQERAKGRSKAEETAALFGNPISNAPSTLACEKCLLRGYGFNTLFIHWIRLRRRMST